MNDEMLQEMIRSSGNAEDVREFASRLGLELTGPELRAATAVVGFRAGAPSNETSAGRRAAFLGRVALQRSHGYETRSPLNSWLRRLTLAVAGIAALAAAAAVGANAGVITDSVAEAVGLRDEKLVNFALRPVGPPPNQDGKVYLEDDGGRTRVQLVIGNTDSIHPVHVHSGTCENLGDVVYRLAPAGPSDSLGPVGAGSQLIDYLPVSLSALQTGNFAITAHHLPATFPNSERQIEELLDERNVVCGNIPKR